MKIKEVKVFNVDELSGDAREFAYQKWLSFVTLLDCADKDYEYYYDEESFIEICEANGYEFLEDGKLF